MLDVLLVKPNEHPRNVSIGAELEDLQQAVGGSIGAVTPLLMTRLLSSITMTESSWGCP